jgi:putative endonuclease
MYTVYVLFSPSHQKIYVGYTSNFEQRMVSHNELGKKGYTYRFRPWKVLFIEEWSTKKEAMQREKSLKQGKGREYIWNIIKTEGLISA